MAGSDGGVRMRLEPADSRELHFRGGERPSQGARAAGKYPCADGYGLNDAATEMTELSRVQLLSNHYAAVLLMRITTKTSTMMRIRHRTPRPARMAMAIVFELRFWVSERGAATR